MREAIISFPMLGEGFSVNPPYCIMLGSFAVYFYGIIIALGLLLAIWYTSKNCARFDMKMDDVYDYLIWAVIFAVIGSRLYYCLTYTDAAGVHTYLRNPVTMLHIRDGGLAIYGGVIGAVLALLLRSRMRHERIWPELDIMAFGLLIGQLVGRWGNFFNREAFGYETDIFCRMGLTLNGSTIYVHPTFLYESLWNFIGLVLLHFHSKTHRKYQGQYFFCYLLWYGIGRAMIESLRSDSLWLVPDVIRISQLLAAVTAVLALIVLLVNRRRVSAGRPPLLGSPLPAGAAVSDEAAAPEESADSTAEEADSDVGDTPSAETAESPETAGTEDTVPAPEADTPAERADNETE